MHPQRKQRLLIILFILVVSGLAAGLLGYALKENINLFYPPADIAAGKAPTGKAIRAGGMVQEGSVQRASDSLVTRFVVTDFSATVTVEYEGILPDLFAEGEGVVASGKLGEDGVFYATEVLAKHDETYMPPEVSDALEKSAASRAAQQEKGSL
ncbi:cytochrome c maturation protein CcmE [Zhongshania marina]|jgi:cytochrome c-type biogenesis protein CcmE|uniref:Cytochrome c-type biogenesis protein CcmE n=1 Tax=Zhongshania marina TaxID=2304603 RepID=A0A2S4HH85_9GAMM|nr:cytochrome c maturation protein CcmE [Marortus luteolus]POP53346.1 cytochrome c maturation protein CcmE [Marortus luteolus]RNL67854.1 cytochrome c maturation protein CcmE [Zhongshania marina]